MREKLFKAIAKNWNGPFPKNYEHARERDCGDGLADFVRIELEEGIDWDTNTNEESIEWCLHILTRASSDLEKAIIAIEQFDFS